MRVLEIYEFGVFVALLRIKHNFLLNQQGVHVLFISDFVANKLMHHHEVLSCKVKGSSPIKNTPKFCSAALEQTTCVFLMNGESHGCSATLNCASYPTFYVGVKDEDKRLKKVYLKKLYSL